MGAVILMSSVAKVAEGGVDDCCCWMEAILTRASADGESSADAVRTGGGVESGLLPPPPAPLAAMADGLASAEGLALRTGERVGDRARVAAAAGAWPMKIGGEAKGKRATRGKRKKNETVGKQKNCVSLD